jgi:hypothetical protein
VAVTINELFSGIETVGTTEHSMTTDTAGPDADTTNGAIQVYVDLSALDKGDQYVIAFYEKVRSGGTQRKVQEWVVANDAIPIWPSPTFMVKHGWDFTIRKLVGTDRSIEWSIRSP